MADPAVTSYRLDAIDLGPRSLGPYTVEHRDRDATAYVPVDGPSDDAKPIPLLSLTDVGKR